MPRLRYLALYAGPRDGDTWAVPSHLDPPARLYPIDSNPGLPRLTTDPGDRVLTGRYVLTADTHYAWEATPRGT